MDSRVNVHILASTSVPFTNLAYKKRITVNVHEQWQTKIKTNKQFSKRSPIFNEQHTVYEEPLSTFRERWENIYCVVRNTSQIKKLHVQ